MSPAFPPVQPHGPLQPIFEDAWFLTGSVRFKPLVRLARNMVVLRHEGALTLIDSVRLDAEGEAALDALGPVKHVLQIGLHGMDDAYYADRYGARRWSPEDLAGADTLPVPGLSVFVFQQTVVPEVALLLDREGGLLITCDSVQHWAPSPLMSTAANLLSGVMGFKNPAQIGPPWRKRQTPPGGSLRPDFERLCALPFRRLIGGHGGLLDQDAQAVLRASVERTFGPA